jgi:hypothetical protein
MRRERQVKSHFKSTPASLSGFLGPGAAKLQLKMLSPGLLAEPDFGGRACSACSVGKT